MTKWEICQCNFEIDWYEGDPDGRCLKILAMKIDDMGEAGWEPWHMITNCIPTNNNKGIKEYRQVWFKRQKL